MASEWFIAVSQSQAKIFQKPARQEPLLYVKTLHNPDGRKKKRDFMTEKPSIGRGKFSKNLSPHAMDGEKNPHDHRNFR
jgi:hypothetical protein